METDKHYFFEGLFIIAFTVAAAVFAVWLGSPGHRDALAPWQSNFKLTQKLE